MIKHIIPSTMSEVQWAKQIKIRPQKILASNSKLKKDGIYNISFPAFHAQVVIGKKLQVFHTCPNAGPCVKYCYAGMGAYGFSGTKIKHHRNLQYLLDDAFSFAEQITKEIAAVAKSNKRFRAIRINDSGDMHLALWTVMVSVMKSLPHVKFYAYTKQVEFMNEQQAKGLIPSNFTYVFSFGGKQDHMINKESNRHAAIFPSIEALLAAHYTDASESDIPASMATIKNVGLVVHGNTLALHKLRDQTNAVLAKSVKL
jgi:hypothetical protein